MPKGSLKEASARDARVLVAFRSPGIAIVSVCGAESGRRPIVIAITSVGSGAATNDLHSHRPRWQWLLLLRRRWIEPPTYSHRNHQCRRRRRRRRRRSLAVA